MGGAGLRCRRLGFDYGVLKKVCRLRRTGLAALSKAQSRSAGKDPLGHPQNK